MGLPINFTFSGFDENYCFTSWEQFGADFTQRLAGETDGDSTFFNDGDTTPSPDNRVYPWTPSSFSGSNPPAFIYHYVNGAWIMPNPIATGAVMMYTGTEASIVTFDGGEAGAITDTTGPMWEKLATMDGRFPLGPGTVNGAVVAVGDQGGEGKHSLTEAEIPPHTHDIEINANDDEGAGSGGDVPDDSATTTSGSLMGITESAGGTDGAVEPHNNIPPYTAIWFIRRTARKYYRR